MTRPPKIKFEGGVDPRPRGVRTTRGTGHLRLGLESVVSDTTDSSTGKGCMWSLDLEWGHYGRELGISDVVDDVGSVCNGFRPSHHFTEQQEWRRSLRAVGLDVYGYG